MTPVFHRQPTHLLLLLLLLTAAWLALHWPPMTEGSLWQLSTKTWFWLAVAAAVGHQAFVWLCWRLELHHHLLTRRLGEQGFRLYAAGFAIFASLRAFTLIALALANPGTVPVNRTILNILALIAAALFLYLAYSVTRYFTYRRAVGIDHFDPSYRNKPHPLVRQGIFRFTRNAMYTFGLLALWLPGLLTASAAALLAALFSHVYIWVHYFCTERPDMDHIYAKLV